MRSREKALDWSLTVEYALAPPEGRAAVLERSEKFNELHNLIWKNFPRSGLPVNYIQHIEDLMKQATLNVLTTIEDIEEIRESSKREDEFNSDDQIVKFCKLFTEGWGNPTNDISQAIYIVAKTGNTKSLSNNDRYIIALIKESIASSIVDMPDHSPIKRPWD